MNVSIGKQFLSYKVWYSQEDNGKTQTKTFDTLRDAQTWLETADPYYWRLDQVLQIILAEKAEPESTEDPTVEFATPTEEVTEPENEHRLNEHQQAAVLELHELGSLANIPGPTMGALRRRGLVYPGYHKNNRSLTRTGIKLAEELKGQG